MDCPNLYPSMCGGKTHLYMSDTCPTSILPYVDGENEVHIPPCIEDESSRIVLYEDGTLVFNEQYEHREENAALHGSVVASWDAYDPETNPYDAVISVGYDFGTDTEAIEEIDGIPWYGYGDQVTVVEFDEYIQPTDISAWFANFTNFVGFDKLENFDITNVTGASALFYHSNVVAFDTSMLQYAPTNLSYVSHMFDHCHSLQYVSLCDWDMSRITNCVCMFKQCESLVTITSWDFPQTANGSNMFYGCTSLAGGLGTTYNSNFIGISRAKVDSSGQVGYFTTCQGIHA